MGRILIVLAMLAVRAAPAGAQSPRDVIGRALVAMGGVEDLRRLPGVTLDFYTTLYGLGQSELPLSPPRATISIGRLTTDWQGGRRATEREDRAVTGAVNRVRLVIAGGIGAQRAGPGWTPLAAGAVIAQERAMRAAPERFLLAAYDDPAALRSLPSRSLRGRTQRGVRYAGRDTMDLWFEDATGLLTVVETTSDDPILGDRITQTWYTRWAPVGGFTYPRQLDILVNGMPNQHTIYTAVSGAAPPDTAFAIPDSVAARAPRGPATPPPLNVTVHELASGVWRLEGGTHHSLVVEQPDGLVLVEAPQSTQRSRAILDTLAARFPARRVKVLVVTHHHWDHAGGIREFVADGVPVATLNDNAAFVRTMAAARRSIRPDRLARRPRAPQLLPFSDSLVIGSGERMVVLYRTPSIHAEGILSAWVPTAAVLFTSDVLNPGPQLAPIGSRELVDLARARGLAPERYAGGHGAVVSWRDIEAAAR